VSAQKTVFFGPFVGEFGWEFKFWQGWVRRMCRTSFAGHRKIVASFSGRRVFYPDADEFWPHPKDLTADRISSLGYITDYWRAGWPRPNRRYEKRSLFGRRRWVKETIEAAGPVTDVEPQFVALLEEYRAALPPETTWFIPWRLNVIADDGLTFGASYPETPTQDEDFVQYSIPFDRQRLTPLSATATGLTTLAGICGERDELMAVFPRRRRLRRPDKNWQQDRWDALIARVRARSPHLGVAILGEPGGSYYEEGVPAGCLDLVNLAADVRLDTQIALLQRARVAVGPVSGALLVAQAAGAPTVQWDYPGRLRIARAVNFFETPMVNLERIDPPVDTVVASMWSLMAETASRPMPVVPSNDNLRDRTRMVSSDFRFKLDETSA
jgi:hypothetical protein